MNKSSDNGSFVQPQQPERHSPRFDELAVALPEHIEPPLLKKLAARLQAKMRHTENTELNNFSLNNTNKNTELSTSAKATLCDALIHDCEIGEAKAILDLLLSTEVADAAVLVAITNEAHPKVLLTRRAGHLNAHAGEVSFAGGKHDLGDRNNVVTALREACEETALPPNKVQIVGQLPPQTSKSGLNVRPIVALVDPNVIYVPELGEIERIFWADLEELMQLQLEEYTIAIKYQGKDVDLETPCWVVDGETVWGLTGCILASLLETGYDLDIDWYYRFSDA